MADRSPPLCPDAMDSVLRASKFTNGADVEKVANLYRSFFDEVSKSAMKLEFRNPDIQGFFGLPGWDKTQASQLATALPFFTACRHLDVAGQSIGDEGVQALSAAVAQMPSLKTLVLVCQFAEAGLQALEAIIGTTNLVKLYLPKELQSTPAGESMKNTWQATGKDVSNLRWHATTGAARQHDLPPSLTSIMRSCNEEDQAFD